jgi:RNA polymerase sigma factor for flagellar operon FliA
MLTSRNVHAATALAESREPAPAQDCSVEANLPLVYELAWKLKQQVGHHVTLEELVSAGTLGLIEALERFDTSRGLKLSTFVIHRIRGSMLDDLRRHDWMPRRLRAKTRNLREAERKVSQFRSRPSQPEEVASALAIPLDQYWKLRDEAGAMLVPLDATSDPASGEIGLDQVVADRNQPEPDAALLDHEMGERLREALDSLPSRERLVLSLTYFENLSGQEIAEILRVSESRVSQIKRRALASLRNSSLLAQVQD